MYGRKPSAALVAYCSSKNGFAVFDVGEANLRISQRLNADLASHRSSKNDLSFLTSARQTYA